MKSEQDARVGEKGADPDTWNSTVMKHLLVKI